MRANATLLFTEAFPVHDPDQNNKNIDEAIQKQLDTVMVRTFKTMQLHFKLEKEDSQIKTLLCHPQALLDDPHPTVRSNATLGVCKILAKCWELLPPTIITDFLKKLVVELAADSSSADVRCSVFKVEDAVPPPILSRKNVAM